MHSMSVDPSVSFSRSRRLLRTALLAGSILSMGGFSDPVQAEVKLPNVFGDSMVLQQKQENKVWGKDNPGRVSPYRSVMRR